MKRILGILFLLLLFQPVLPHNKARYHVIVDTDGGIDDFRAICMMLASPEIEVVAITAVDGILPPEETACRIQSLLKHFRHEGIPVGMGTKIAGAAAPKKMESMASSVQWVKEESPGSGVLLPGATDLILYNIELEEMPVDIIALGPLSNVASILKENPPNAKGIRRIYWYSDAGDHNDFNYRLDAASAGAVLESGIALDRISGKNAQLNDLDEFVGVLDIIPSPYARAVSSLYKDPAPGFSKHYMATHLNDDCVPIYMLYPQYFLTDTTGEQPMRRISRASEEADFSTLLLDILDSDREDKSILFGNFPADPLMFREDVAQIAPAIIEKYGMKEWKIVVMTNEFHEHLGIYSILGAKMGLRAREYFHLGIDELEIRSFAGSKPPISCLNDGLQVSTGATLGHGTISLEEGTAFPKACFSFKDQTIELSIRKDIRDQIKKDVGYGVQTYGLESPAYWEYIRKLALEYWLKLDRHEVFALREIPLNGSSSHIR